MPKSERAGVGLGWREKEGGSMKGRMLLIMAAVAVIAMIAPHGHAATKLCGGTAPRESTCTVESLEIGTDNPMLQVTVSPVFVGVVSAKMTGANGGTSEVSCLYSLDPTGARRIKSDCATGRQGTILKGETVHIDAVTTGKPGALPAIGTWAVEYRAS
jgi:hypothetical protein